MEQITSQAKSGDVLSADNGYLPSEFIQKALSALTPRSKEVLVKRFNLDGGKKRTLHEIGQLFKITRERIRQIEKDSLVRVREVNSKDIVFFDTVFKSIISEMGGCVEYDFLLDKLVEYFDDKNPDKMKNKEGERQNLVFILSLVDTIKYQRPDKNFKSLFFLGNDYLVKAETVIEAAVRIFNAKKKAMPFEELFEAVISQELFKEEKNSKMALYSYLSLSNKVERNPFEEWGLKDWPMVFPRSVRDKAYLVVVHQASPLHFKEITRLIDEKWGKKKKPALPETVHNELIKDKRFVLVGRGIYGLSEQGYERGAVRDIIKNILASAGRAMSREEILKKVSAQRMVKSGTVVLNLKDKEYFEKTKEGLYKLK